MKTTEVSKDLIGRRCECIFTGMMVTGVIEDTEVGEPISQIDRSVFEDADTWGVCSLQGWVNSYESVRFVAINDHTAVITGEYNFEQVKVWLEKYVPVKSLKIS